MSKNDHITLKGVEKEWKQQKKTRMIVAYIVGDDDPKMGAHLKFIWK